VTIPMANRQTALKFHLGGRSGVTAALSAGVIICLTMALLAGGTLPAHAQKQTRKVSGKASTLTHSPIKYANKKSIRSTAKKAKKLFAKKEKREKAQPPPEGPLQIIVSLSNQRVKIYHEGAVIAEAPISTGTASHSTPTGVFSVIQKNRFHRSNIYSNAPMPFMQRLTWSGVALHEGMLPGYPASHGCIRLPKEFALKLWGMTRLGARVIVARDEVVPVAFTHPLLFVPQLKSTSAVTELRPSLGEPVTTIAPVTANVLITGENSKPIVSADASDVIGTADGTVTATDATNPVDESDGPPPWTVKPVKSDIAWSEKTPPLRPGPVSVLISLKEGRLFVRKSFGTVFDAPVTIRNPDRPIGTHVLTALGYADGNAAMRWVAMTLPGDLPKPQNKKAARRNDDILNVAHNPSRKGATGALIHLPPPQTASEALDRIEIPRETISRIAEMLSPGATLIVSDHGRGDETGLETDFVVLTR